MALTPSVAAFPVVFAVGNANPSQASRGQMAQGQMEKEMQQQKAIAALKHQVLLALK